MSSDDRYTDKAAKASGWPTGEAVKKSTLRHELVHSIQASKRGYGNGPTKLRQVVGDEIAAYSVQDRGLKDKNVKRKAMRAVSKPLGVVSSSAHYIKNDKILRKRAGTRLKQGVGVTAISAGVAIPTAVAANKRKKAQRRELGYNPDLIEFRRKFGPKSEPRLRKLKKKTKKAIAAKGNQVVKSADDALAGAIKNKANPFPQATKQAKSVSNEVVANTTQKYEKQIKETVGRNWRDHKGKVIAGAAVGIPAIAIAPAASVAGGVVAGNAIVDKRRAREGKRKNNKR